MKSSPQITQNKSATAVSKCRWMPQTAVLGHGAPQPALLMSTLPLKPSYQRATKKAGRIPARRRLFQRRPVAENVNLGIPQVESACQPQPGWMKFNGSWERLAAKAAHNVAPGYRLVGHCPFRYCHHKISLGDSACAGRTSILSASHHKGCNSHGDATAGFCRLN